MKEKNTNKIFFIVMVCVVIIFIFYGGTILYLSTPISELSVNKAGVFGDSFGALTALFSGLAFAGMIWTIYLQRSDLNMQQQQLSLQLEEMEAARSEMATQSKIQRAHFYAVKAQLRTNKIQAEIEAVKIGAAGLHPGIGSRSKQIAEINELAEQIGAQARGLDKLNLE